MIQHHLGGIIIRDQHINEPIKLFQHPELVGIAISGCIFRVDKSLGPALTIIGYSTYGRFIFTETCPVYIGYNVFLDNGLELLGVKNTSVIGNFLKAH